MIKTKNSLKKSGSTKKVFTKTKPSIFTRHPSIKQLREYLPLFPYRVTVRFGSTTESIARIQINSIQGVRNSSNKLLMKQCFDKAGVKTAPWCKATEFKNQFEFPIVVKNHYGSRGTGNYKFDDVKSFNNWKQNRDLSSYIIEKYLPYKHEFRLHISKNGCFYTCRKALKKDVPKDKQWSRHDDNCVWFTEENSQFYKPSNWNIIVKECTAALAAIGLDTGAFDIRVQGNEKNKKSPDFFIIEVNSAPSMAEGTLKHYSQELPKLIKEKYEDKLG